MQGTSGYASSCANISPVSVTEKGSRRFVSPKKEMLESSVPESSTGLKRKYEVTSSPSSSVSESMKHDIVAIRENVTNLENQVKAASKNMQELMGLVEILAEKRRAKKAKKSSKKYLESSKQSAVLVSSVPV